MWCKTKHTGWDPVANPKQWVRDVHLLKENRKINSRQFNRKQQKYHDPMKICRAMRETTNKDKTYFLKLTTTPHRYTYADPIFWNSDVKDLFLEHIACLVCITGITVKKISCNDAKNFVGIKPIWKKMQITLITSCTYSPHWKRWAEKVDRTLMDKLRSPSNTAVSRTDAGMGLYDMLHTCMIYWTHHFCRLRPVRSIT